MLIRKAKTNLGIKGSIVNWTAVLSESCSRIATRWQPPLKIFFFFGKEYSVKVSVCQDCHGRKTPRANCNIDAAALTTSPLKIKRGKFKSKSDLAKNSNYVIQDGGLGTTPIFSIQVKINTI